MWGNSKRKGLSGISNCRFLLITSFVIHAFLLLPIREAQSTDEQALLAFKASISSDPSGVLTAWMPTNGSMNTTNNVCQWSGVSCLSRQHPGRVTALELMSSNLTGVISPSLANLSFLHTLNLTGNRLSGSLPFELGMLRRLQVISLGENSLTGEIPASLTNCARLTHVELQLNGLHGEIPANFSSCRELRAFNVSVNSLSGGIPPSFGSLSNLEFLGLHRSNLTGGIPLSFGNLSSLLAFDASENYNLGGNIPDVLGRLTKLNFFRLAFAGLRGTIPASLFNISSLRTLDLGNNDISGVLPLDMGITLPRVQFLSLYNCQLEGRIPSSIGNATGLRIIQLQSNSLQGIVPTDIGRLKNLEVLNLQFNLLEDKWDKDWPLMAALGNCSKLRALSLSSNKFQGVFPPSLANLTIGIQKIFMNSNRISGTISPEIGRLSNLNLLVLARNAVTGTIPDTIGGLNRMNGLDISSNNISGEIPPMLVANLTQLAFLDLSRNELQGSIPESFGTMRNIAILDLSYNQFSGMLPKQVFNLSSLTVFLNMSHNIFSGPIPSEVGRLSSLGMLDLSNNRLSGEIPQTLSQCQAMEYLFLQGNRLDGRIPASLNSLKGLQYLDMSQNNLSGPTPNFLATLQDLQYLNLSYNQFDGPVPTRGVFNNSRNFSVAGNKVCGGVSELQLPKCPDTDNSGKRLQKSRTVLIVAITIGSFLALLLITCTFVMCARNSVKEQHVHGNDTSHARKLMEPHWKVSYAELLRATDGFSDVNLIGVGSFGSVYRGILGHEEQEVAIKVLNLLQHGAEQSFLAECEALRSVRHRNLVKIITACSTMDHMGQDFKALVYEFMPNRDLDKWLHSTGGEDGSSSRMLNMTERVSIALDVAVALDYLHHHGQVPIVHCDLKPSNVLLDNNMVAHVGDFGLSRFINGGNSNLFQHKSNTGGIKGTIGYITPEYGMSGEVSVEGDVYSYGVLLLEMFTAKRPTDPLFQGGEEYFLELFVQKLDTAIIFSTSQTQSSPSLTAPAALDEQALLSFKTLIIGDPHGVLASWTSGNGHTTNSTGFCNWRGVGCHSRRHPGRVTSLELTSSNLTGTVSPFLANLTFLRILNLSSNSFSGNIPWEIGLLPRLSYLHLGHNSLQGLIPPSLARASKLRVLQLEYNSLGGEIPANLSYLQELEGLDIGANQLSGAIPPSLGSLSKLTYLGLYLNNLAGGVPPSFGNLSLLQKLFADTSTLSGKVRDSLGRLTKLQSLDLAYNQLSGAIPRSLFNISSITTFELCGNNALSGVLPSDIGFTLPNIQYLFLYDCQLSGRIPRSIGNASQLRHIELNDNELHGTVPLDLGINLKNLEVLLVENNHLEDKWSSDWDLIIFLSNCTNLLRLALGSNNFQGVFPPSPVNLSTTLQSLNLDHSKIHGAISSDIWKLSSLAILNLRGNLLTGSIPPTMGELYNLGFLDLSENNISGQIPPTLGNLTSLTTLYLFMNSLQGSIPASLGKLQTIASLVLSVNQLSGAIPEQLVSLSSLTNYLGLSYNSLTGQIPLEVGKLTNLVRLDLPANKLSGDIPLTLGKCVELLHLELQENLLQGPVPVKGVFSNASAFFVVGNKVCGVYKGTIRQGSQHVAIKVIDLLQHGAERSFLAECRVLRSIRHRNLVKVVTACSSIDHQGNDFKALVCEFMPNGDLDKWLHHNLVTQDEAPRRRLTMFQRVNIELDVAEALDYLHHHGQVPIVHCDLKPSNVLLDDDMVAHVGDFGLARFVRKMVNNSIEESSTSAGIKGSIGYIPPEYGMHGNISIQGDVYSYGILLFEMFTGKRPASSLFQEGQTLQSYVSACYPERIMEIADPILLPRDNRFISNGDGSCDETDTKRLQECMASIFRVGLQCSQESSRARMDIRNAIRARGDKECLGER
ncbi:hypothetical protein EJB05_00273 [Eragrostis curvula]|uniref:Receptor kinase-like protein Xa21 n=1 Tax=Eragrostis curvula TaxID=38414 RepID=A0A5J9WNX1_9POAL|nr:hypothetical protein EJB05_00273 [Eragrostis curvula]